MNRTDWLPSRSTTLFFGYLVTLGIAKKGRMLRIIAPREAQMARMFVDCREYPSEMNCTVAISADTKEELVDAAVQHAVAVHGHHDSPQLRQELAKMIKTQ
jgi:predicted small metal-binding protein